MPMTPNQTLEDLKRELQAIDSEFAIVPSEEHYKTGMATKHWKDIKVERQIKAMLTYVRTLLPERKERIEHFMGVSQAEAFRILDANLKIAGWNDCLDTITTTLAKEEQGK